MKAHYDLSCQIMVRQIALIKIIGALDLLKQKDWFAPVRVHHVLVLERMTHIACGSKMAYALICSLQVKMVRIDTILNPLVE